MNPCAERYRTRRDTRTPVSVRRLTHAEFRQSQQLAFKDDRLQIAAHYGGRRRRKSARSARIF